MARKAGIDLSAGRIGYWAAMNDLGWDDLYDDDELAPLIEDREAFDEGWREGKADLKAERIETMWSDLEVL